MYFLYYTYRYFYLFLTFNINNMPKETPRKRKSLTAAQKKKRFAQRKYLLLL